MSAWAYKQCQTCGEDVHIGSLCSTCGGDPLGVIARQLELERAARKRLAKALESVERARKDIEETMENRILLQARAQFTKDAYVMQQVNGRSNERRKDDK